jgi:hypothetical protein
MAGAIARVNNVFSGGSLVAGYQASAVPCSLQEIVVTNTGAAVVYAQVHNVASTPADAQVPVITFAVPATSSASYDSQQGVVLSVGCYVCISSTAPTKTLGAAEATFSALIEA